ncbi:MAG: pyruvate kinase [Halieaceae bacterium]|jgi:pyruvate kinase|nr:pyruvate kinase [Halieaceae bacterium]
MSRTAPRRTKIVATIGPTSESAEMIARLVQAGVDVFRLNMSHGDIASHTSVARRIREQAAKQGRYVGILADLQGPKIRISSFAAGSVDLLAGDRFRLDADLPPDAGDRQAVSFSYRPMLKNLREGDVLLLDDGRIRLRVERVEAASLDCTVLVGGRLGSRKGINRLGGGIAAPALTEKDLEDITGLVDIEPDYLAVSFVSSLYDIQHAKDLLREQGIHAAVIAKIERAEVVADKNVLDGIFIESDGIMVARGDLGVEVGDAELIGIQKDLIARARRMDRLVITATQMMESMINSSMPTRAEVFDVANAVLDGTDAVMLSAETAVGRYPVEVVSSMADAALGAERHPVARTSRYRVDRQFNSAQESIAMSAIYAANHFSRVRGIACLTESGTTPLLMSRLSSGLPIFGLSPNARTLARLSLCRGVVPLYFDAASYAADALEQQAIDFLRAGYYLERGDALILTRGERVGDIGSTNILKILAV